MSLLIATPMFGGQCTVQYFRSSLKLREDLIRANVDHEWLTTRNESLITRARNTSVRSFMSTEFQKLLFIDADIEFRSEDVALLWNADKPIIAGAYRRKSDDAKLEIWKAGRLVPLTADKPVSVDFAGTGFMMIDREVFAELAHLVPEYDESTGEGVEQKPTRAYFQDPIVEHTDGSHYHQSEDYFLCELWRRAGGEVLVHPGVKLVHWGQKGY